MKNGAPRTKRNPCCRHYEINIVFTVVSFLLDFNESKFDSLYSFAKRHISNLKHRMSDTGLVFNSGDDQHLPMTSNIFEGVEDRSIKEI